MAIFQVPDLSAARGRLAVLGVRVVWSVRLPDVASIHLHPKDVPGAIVSLDWADPPASWRWAGPAWIGGAPEHKPGGVTGVTVEVKDPAGAAARWAAVLGLSASTEGETAAVELSATGQCLRFVPASSDRGEGITEVRIAPLGRAVRIGGVRFAQDGG
jgi:hypothetical protein